MNCTTTYSNATLSRQDVGQWTCGFETFPKFGDAFTVTVTSAANPSLTTAIDVTIVSRDYVQVTFDPSSGIATASSAAGNTEFYWAVSPSSAGTAAPVPGNAAQANITLTAPDSAYAVCAYYADISGSYGFGQVWQNLPSPGS